MGAEEEREPIVLKHYGQKIFAVYHKPLQSGKIPGVILCPGLAGTKIGRSRVYVQLAKRLAAAGVAVLRIDYRGSGDSEGELEEMTVQGAAEDVLQGIDFLFSREEIDPDRLGLFGRSFGGAMAALAASQSKKIKSLGLWAALFSGKQWYDQWELLSQSEAFSSSKKEGFRINGQKISPLFLEQLIQLDLTSPLQALSSASLFHMYGNKDAILNPEQAEGFAACRLHALGKTRFISLPEGDHDFSEPLHRERALEATLEWFKETL